MPTLTFDDDDMAVLNQAIGELPHRLAVPFIAKINAQLGGSDADQSRGSGNSDSN